MQTSNGIGPFCLDIDAFIPVANSLFSQWPIASLFYDSVSKSFLFSDGDKSMAKVNLQGKTLASFHINEISHIPINDIHIKCSTIFRYQEKSFYVLLGYGSTLHSYRNFQNGFVCLSRIMNNELNAEYFAVFDTKRSSPDWAEFGFLQLAAGERLLASFYAYDRMFQIKLNFKTKNEPKPIQLALEDYSFHQKIKSMSIGNNGMEESLFVLFADSTIGKFNLSKPFSLMSRELIPDKIFKIEGYVNYDLLFVKSNEHLLIKSRKGDRHCFLLLNNSIDGPVEVGFLKNQNVSIEHWNSDGDEIYAIDNNNSLILKLRFLYTIERN